MFDFEEEDDDGFGFDLSPLLDLPPEAEATVRAMIDAMRKPLAPGDPRRHHYVPRFYLRRFADEDQLARVRLEKPGDHDVANVNDVAVMKDLYTTVDIDIGETVAVERLLGVLDGLAAGAMARLALGVLFPPQQQDRLNFGLWLSMLHVRGPDTRRTMEMIADQAMKLQMSLVRDEESARAHLRGDDGAEPDDETVQALLDSVADMDTWEIAPHQNDLVKNMLQIGLQASPFFIGRRWAVVKFPEKGLVLTDKPLVMYQKPENRSGWMGVGIGTADELWLPLDRSTALILHTEKGVADIVIDAPLGHGVDDFNQAVVGQAYREVYCHPDDLPRLDRLTFPSLDRPLMSVSGASWMKGSVDGVNAPPRRRSHHRYRRSS
jgi:hypothetical protein